jgi:hypothetical protein
VDDNTVERLTYEKAKKPGFVLERS